MFGTPNNQLLFCQWDDFHTAVDQELKFEEIGFHENLF